MLIFNRLTRRTSAVSLQFYEAFSKSAILRKPASVHERIIGLVRDELAHLLPRGEFRAVGNHSISPGLSDPDLQLLQSGKGKRIPKSIFAIEVGFSQPSEDLEERVKRLLRESTVKVAMLFDIKETPKYKNPFTINEPKNLRRTGNMSKTTDTKPTTAEIHIETYKSQRSQTDLESSLCLEDSRNPYSPVFIYGVRWVGELTGVVQVFAKDPVSGDVVARTKKTVRANREYATARCTNIVDLAFLWATRGDGSTVEAKAEEAEEKPAATGRRRKASLQCSS
jgi:hypothetical protein